MSTTPAAVSRRQKLVTEILLLAALLLLAGLIRFAGRHELTPDMRIFFVWSEKLRAAGGFRGLKEEIGNYNAPFLYLLALTLYLPGATLIKIKLVWVCFDAVLAFFTYRIVALRRPGRRIPAVAALIMLFLPTVAINASLYGQTDSMWAAFALGGVYYLLRDKPWWAVSMCTVALAFKPQGIFIFPLLGLLVLLGRLPWKSLLAVPLVYVALDLPAMLLGRDPVELLTIYDPGRQSAYTPGLTQNAPSVFAYLPVTTRIDTLRSIGYVLTAALILGICYVLVARRARMHPDRIVTAATVFVILTPYFLPGMHERYFYLADVMALVLAFYRPRLWPVPLLVQAASFLAYEPFLFIGTPHGPFVSMKILATFLLAALVITTYTLLVDPADRTEPAEPVDQPEPAEPAEPVERAEPVSPPAASREPLPAHPA
jgi:Gpi18-like mannosyltransferase